jgi:methylmalonyl-CoA mutase cobalamin-binding subunit
VREAVIEMLRNWEQKDRPPTRDAYLAGARRLEALRSQAAGGGLWSRPPRMLTATLDDGWGHGLEVIEALATAVGVAVQRLGLLQTAAAIVDACRAQQPDLLGLTVLQFDSDDDLSRITQALPPATTLVAGGAAFRYDPDFAVRTGTPVVARNGAAFLQFLLQYDFRPQGGAR